MVGTGHWLWRGGAYIGKGGYRYRWVVDAGHGTPGYVPEHRWVMEQHLGRPLAPTETIHHRDDDRTNNRLSNLELCANRGDHSLTHHVQRDPAGRFQAIPADQARRRVPRAAHVDPAR